MDEYFFFEKKKLKKRRLIRPLEIEYYVRPKKKRKKEQYGDSGLEIEVFFFLFIFKFMYIFQRKEISSYDRVMKYLFGISFHIFFAVEFRDE